MGEKLRENWSMILFTAFAAAFMSIAATSVWAKWNKIGEAVPLATYESDKKEFNKELNKKSTYKYVDDAFADHDLSDTKNFNALKELMTAYLIGQKGLIESIDKRLERLENQKNQN